MNKILLDTNAYTQLLTGDDEILAAVASTDVIFMSIFVLGELQAGFAGGKKQRGNKDILRRFLSKPSVKILNATSETAEVFGSLKNKLTQAGTPLPINDVWIAAHGIETGSMIVTYDRHFHQVSGVRLWDGIR